MDKIKKDKKINSILNLLFDASSNERLNIKSNHKNLFLFEKDKKISKYHRFN